MNKDQFAGNWKIFKGKVKEKWGKLTDDELATVNGKREQLVGLIQKKYGFAKDRVEKELSSFEATFEPQLQHSTSTTTPHSYEQGRTGSFQNRGNVEQGRGGSSSSTHGTTSQSTFGKPGQNPTQSRNPSDKGSKGKR